METETYPAGWTRIAILSDRAIVTCRAGKHSSEGLRRRVQAVLDVEAVRLGRCSSGFVPPSFVYHVSVSGTAVFNYRGEPRNAIASSHAPDVHRKARLAAQRDAPHPWEASVVVFPLRRTDAAGIEIVGPESAAPGALRAHAGGPPLFRRDDTPAPVKTARSAAKMQNFGNPPPRPPVQRIDGLTPHQCFQAFEAAQREQRTFELELPVHAALQSPCEIWCDTEYRRVRHVSDLGSEIRVEFIGGSADRYPRNVLRRVRRSTALTPAQRDAARAIWARMLRLGVAASSARDAKLAPSVAIANEDLEVEALAADVP